MEHLPLAMMLAAAARRKLLATASPQLFFDERTGNYYQQVPAPPPPMRRCMNIYVKPRATASPPYDLSENRPGVSSIRDDKTHAKKPRDPQSHAIPKRKRIDAERSPTIVPIFSPGNKRMRVAAAARDTCRNKVSRAKAEGQRHVIDLTEETSPDLTKRVRTVIEPGVKQMPPMVGHVTSVQTPPKMHTSNLVETGVKRVHTAASQMKEQASESNTQPAVAALNKKRVMIPPSMKEQSHARVQVVKKVKRVRKKKSISKELQWARKHFEELMRQGHISSNPTDIHSWINKKKSEGQVMPVNVTIRTWLKEERDKVGFDSGSGPIKKQVHSWARSYFIELMEKGYATWKAKEIHEMLVAKSGNKSVPKLGTLAEWLAKVRKETGVHRKNLDVARAYFDALIQQHEEHLSSTAKDILRLIEQNVTNEPIPLVNTVTVWLKEKRLEAADRITAEVLKESKERFDYLMRKGHIAASAKQIRLLLREKDRDAPAPSLTLVKTWLREKRLEAGYVHSHTESTAVWARNYFETMMKQGRVSSTERDIHNLMLLNAGDERVPGVTAVRTWLIAERKRVLYKKR